MLQVRWATAHDLPSLLGTMRSRSNRPLVRDVVTCISIAHVRAGSGGAWLGVAPWSTRHPSLGKAVRTGLLTILDLVAPRPEPRSLQPPPAAVRLIGLVSAPDDPGDVFQLRGFIDDLQHRAHTALHLHVAAGDRRLVQVYSALGFIEAQRDADTIEMVRTSPCHAG